MPAPSPVRRSRSTADNTWSDGRCCAIGRRFAPTGWLAIAMTNYMPPRTATLIGLAAILMWSLLASFTVATGNIPAFQLAAMTFAIGGVGGFVCLVGRP